MGKLEVYEKIILKLISKEDPKIEED